MSSNLYWEGHLNLVFWHITSLLGSQQATNINLRLQYAGSPVVPLCKVKKSLNKNSKIARQGSAYLIEGALNKIGRDPAVASDSSLSSALRSIPASATGDPAYLFEVVYHRLAPKTASASCIIQPIPIPCFSRLEEQRYDMLDSDIVSRPRERVRSDYVFI